MSLRSPSFHLDFLKSQSNSFKLKSQLAFEETRTLATGQTLRRALSLIGAQVGLRRRIHAEADLRSALVCEEENILAATHSGSSPAKTNAPSGIAKQPTG